MKKMMTKGSILHQGTSLEEGLPSVGRRVSRVMTMMSLSAMLRWRKKLLMKVESIAAVCTVLSNFS